jgi:lysophospholipid acyltransferase (LPLAT)-like uncharacterized protein
MRTLERGLVLLYGGVMAALLVLLWGLLKLTVRVRHLDRPADFGQRQTIDCAWHESLLPYFVAGLPYRKPYVWMNHPAWYMKGIHLYLRLMGVRQLVLGSSGHGGRRALDGVATLLEQESMPGALPSTFLNPDGPYGPAHRVKDGVLDLAQRTGAPVVALHLRCHHAWRAPSWDRKFVPLPFSRLDVIYSPGWHVTADNREAVRAAIQRHLDGADAPPA